uniref:Uncharacterized protein n=1 Tax=Arundo donax TaxID=35708 RepID=A0A0A9FMA6_ARUDO
MIQNKAYNLLLNMFMSLNRSK